MVPASTNTTLVGATPAAAGMSWTTALSYAGPIMAVAGAVQSGFGAYFAAANAKSGLAFQSEMNTINARMSEINARMAENTAQSILKAGEYEQGRVSLRAGKVKSAQKASMAARGIQLGVGSAAEEIATTDLMKETDMMSINANAVRAAWTTRMQGVLNQAQTVNAGNAALLQGVSAGSVNPFMSMGSSLLGSAATVASSWYSHRQSQRMADYLTSRGVE